MGYRYKIRHKEIEALLGAGASRSFVAPSLAQELKLLTQKLGKGIRSQGINGKSFEINTHARGVKCRVNEYVCTWDFPVVNNNPYRVMLDADWLKAEGLTWDMEGDRLYVGQGAERRQIRCRWQYGENMSSRNETWRQQQEQEDKTGARQGHGRMLRAVQRMGKDGADISARPSPKHYKCSKNKGKLIFTEEILLSAKQQQKTRMQHR